MSSTTTRRGRRRVLALTAAAVFTLGGLAACGDDDDNDDEAASATEATEATETTETTETTDADAFCAAELAAESAIAAESPDADAAVDALLDAAPDDDVRGAVEAVLANAEAGAGDPAFDEAYGDVVAYMQEHCELAELTVTAVDYEYDGLPSEADAGPTLLSVANEGAEPHVVFLVRVLEGDDADATAEEIVQLPEEDLAEAVEVVNGTFLAPGVSSFVPADLTPGRYVLFCPLPDADGTPHSELGQFAELTVD